MITVPVEVLDAAGLDAEMRAIAEMAASGSEQRAALPPVEMDPAERAMEEQPQVEAADVWIEELPDVPAPGGGTRPDGKSVDYVPAADEGETPTGDEGKLQIRGYSDADVGMIPVKREGGIVWGSAVTTDTPPATCVLYTGAADVGSSTEAARADHVHKLPSTVVDTFNDQTIGGVKVFTRTVVIYDSNPQAGSLLPVLNVGQAGSGTEKTRVERGVVRLYLAQPQIAFHFDKAATATASITERYSGILVISGHPRIGSEPISEGEAGYDALQVASTGWVYGKIPAKATSNPADVVLSTGTAAIGTSVKYAAEDHVHKLPNTVVDTFNDQTIGGAKTFTGYMRVASGFIWLFRGAANPALEFRTADGAASTSRIVETAAGEVTIVSPGYARLSVAPPSVGAEGYNGLLIATTGWANGLRKTFVAGDGIVFVVSADGKTITISATNPGGATSGYTGARNTVAEQRYDTSNKRFQVKYHRETWVNGVMTACTTDTTWTTITGGQAVQETV